MESLASKFLPIEATNKEELFVSSALEWLKENTTINLEDEEDLPYSVKLFVFKYVEIMESNGTVASESIAGMSQSFTAKALQDQIWELAHALLGPWLKSQVVFKTSTRKWESLG